MKRWLIILSPWLALFTGGTASAWAEPQQPGSPTAEAAPPRELRVAVLAFRGTERAQTRWSSTMAYLSEQIPGYRFRAVPLNLEQLDQAVPEGSVDFAITHAGQYVRVGSGQSMSGLTTLKSRRHPGRPRVIGSALVVRADSNYHRLEDLRQARLGAVSPLAFGGFQIYWDEMVRRGYRPEHFFSELKFAGFPVDALAFWVRDALVDGAILPACLLETLHEEGLIDAADFRVLEPRDEPGFSCQTSSQLYPNWSIAALQTTPTAVTEQVARALLLMPPDAPAAKDSGALGWTAPASSYAAHQLYQRLDIHPWQKPWWQTLQIWLRQNWQWGLVLLLAMVLGFSHHLWVQLLVGRRSRELQRVQGQLRQQQLQLEHAQRVAILGELSSDLAHELNQPLAAINSYAEGGLVRLRKGTAPLDSFTLLERISQEAQRGGRIIQRIRGFARKEGARRERVDLGALVTETLKLLDYELSRKSLGLTVKLPSQPLTANVDPVEIQQLLVNLIHNGIEAMEGLDAERRLSIHCRATSPEAVVISVEDSGRGVDPQSLSELFKPFYSTKPQGLGLGLSICRRIAESHGGWIQIEPGVPGGTRVTCHLARETHAHD